VTAKQPYGLRVKQPPF